MESIVASTIQIELKSESYVYKPYPKHLHGLCYFLAGKDYPHVKYRPPEFHPFIRQWNSSKLDGTEAIIQIQCIGEALTYAMLHTLDTTRELWLGHGSLKITHYSLNKQEVLPLNHLQATPVPTEFKLVFLTPTRFRTFQVDRYHTKAYPDLRLLIRSMARSIHILYNVKISINEQEELIRSISIINVIGYPVDVKIDRYSKYDDSFVGEIHLSCHQLSDEQRRLFGMLLKVAKYSGVGHKKGYGFGHIELKRA